LVIVDTGGSSDDFEMPDLGTTLPNDKSQDETNTTVTAPTEVVCETYELLPLGYRVGYVGCCTLQNKKRGTSERIVVRKSSAADESVVTDSSSSTVTTTTPTTTTTSTSTTTAASANGAPPLASNVTVTMRSLNDRGLLGAAASVTLAGLRPVGEYIHLYAGSFLGNLVL